MKYFSRIILTMCLLLALVFVGTLCSFAAEGVSEENGVDTSYWFGNVEVRFGSDSALTAEQQEALAAWLIDPSTDKTAGGEASTYGFTCWLTGHKYEKEVVVVVEHKVYDSAPRCREYIYDVSTCTRCDHVEEELVNTFAIDCCK